jgi:hypothetical protein
MKLNLNNFIWLSHQQAWCIEWKDQSTSPSYKVSANLVLKCLFNA